MLTFLLCFPLTQPPRPKGMYGRGGRTWPGGEPRRNAVTADRAWQDTRFYGHVDKIPYRNTLPTRSARRRLKKMPRHGPGRE